MSLTRRELIKIMAAASPVVLAPKAFGALSHLVGTEDLDLSAGRKFNFNSDWSVKVGDVPDASNPDFDDSGWQIHTLPYAWNENDAFKVSIDELSTGIAWYRKRFKLPEACRNKKIFFECEGIRQAGTFYLNGKEIGLSENGVMAFGFDLTDLIKFGDEENVLAARIDNSWDYREKATNSRFQWNDKNFYANYGGINKNVYIHVTPKIYQTLPIYSNLGTTGVYVYANEFEIQHKKARINVASQIKNETDSDQKASLEVLVFDLEGKKIKTFSGDNVKVNAGNLAVLRANALINDLNFWSWGYGYLYTLQTNIIIDGKIVDTEFTKTGFRKTEFKDGMIYLNDRVIQVHGYAQRTTNEWPSIGLSVPAWLSDYSNGLMVEGNANLVRWMHVTPWKQDVESCDRVGLMQAMPAGDSEGDVKDRRWEQRKEVMRDAIIYNKNNPSIVFYECGNKGIMDSQMQEMKNIRDAYDPHGGRAIGAREMLASKVAEYGGEMLYIDKSATKPLWEMEYSRDEGLRKYWDNYTPPFHKDGDGPLYRGGPAKEYNRNMQSHAIEDVVRWFEYWKARPGTGKRVSSGGVNIVFADTNTHHRGAENYRCSGEVDAMRIKKQNFFANQVMWDGWVEVEKPSMHIIGHWNYKKGVEKDIYVVSSSPKVELFCNGKSLGFGQKSNEFLFTFESVRWKKGILEAKGYNEQKQVICSDKLMTIGEPHHLKLTEVKRPTAFVADGHDLALVEVEVVDENGHRCPTALNMIQFELEGPAEWKGGIAVGPNNYIGSQNLPVEGGVNRVLIRSKNKAGTINLTANSDNLQGAKLALNPQAISVTNGLSHYFASSELKPSLGRGATPNTPSYFISRIPVGVKSTKVAINENNAQNSYDDNEKTAWENDGKLSTAWIEYTLERPATIHQIDIKLNSFRTKSYPLQITVDGKVVFNGETEKCLGYNTLVCKPVSGSIVRIQLTGATQEGKDIIGEEVSGKVLGDGVKTLHANAKGSLSIIEVEFYELVKNK
ncbi:DUF4982 domain-containing protein [Arachidicoccus soli]|nr:DUF4982 domain-containing protein [Arachidicoccus soli]